MLGTVGFAFLAGLLSVLSPCVLPLIPIVLGTAAAEHRLGPVALAAGLAVAFTAIGLFVATIGFTVGLDGDVFRRAGAVLLVLLGAVLMLPRLQARVATAASPIGAWAEDRFGGAGSGGVSGQFAVGLLLTTFGTFWSVEGLGVFGATGESLEWPGETWALLGLLAGWTLFARLAVAALRRIGRVPVDPLASEASGVPVATVAPVDPAPTPAAAGPAR